MSTIANEKTESEPSMTFAEMLSAKSKPLTFHEMLKTQAQTNAIADANINTFLGLKRKESRQPLEANIFLKKTRREINEDEEFECDMYILENTKENFKCSSGTDAVGDSSANGAVKQITSLTEAFALLSQTNSKYKKCAGFSGFNMLLLLSSKCEHLIHPYDKEKVNFGVFSNTTFASHAKYMACYHLLHQTPVQSFGFGQTLVQSSSLDHTQTRSSSISSEPEPASDYFTKYYSANPKKAGLGVPIRCVLDICSLRSCTSRDLSVFTKDVLKVDDCNRSSSSDLAVKLHAFIKAISTQVRDTYKTCIVKPSGYEIYNTLANASALGQNDGDELDNLFSIENLLKTIVGIALSEGNDNDNDRPCNTCLFQEPNFKLFTKALQNNDCSCEEFWPWLVIGKKKYQDSKAAKIEALKLEQKKLDVAQFEGTSICYVESDPESEIDPKVYKFKPKKRCAKKKVSFAFSALSFNPLVLKVN